MQLSTSIRQRHQLINNVLVLAAEHGLPVGLAAFLDRPVRVRDRDTDHVVTVPLRSLRADDVRAD